jgi:hypothetical protein
MNVQSVHSAYNIDNFGPTANTVVVQDAHGGDSPNMTSSIQPSDFRRSDLNTFDQTADLGRYATSQAGPVFLKAHTPTGTRVDTHR